jgi:xanthine dehydrogenase YagR molybdenum-binding subunit
LASEGCLISRQFQIGDIGTAAAMANAVHHAAGVRVRHLPIHLDKLLGG